MNVLKFILWLCKIVGSVASFLYFYKKIFVLIGVFFTRRFPPAKNKHKYAVVIAARNEEKVIGNLISSIKQQDYPSELVTIFVVADNCTDATARIARERGAICYERFDASNRTKGHALQFLFEQIKRDFSIEAFEGYFIFDADNLLNKDYISKMNDAFDSGEKIITSYRNTKNFDENWIAATYALHWLRTVRNEHRARSVLRLATRIQGTGFLFTNEIVKDGWKYTSLTEDRALTADAVVNGYRISYNDEAIFYDEQPTSLKIAMRQRIRWAKGHLQAFTESGGELFVNIFKGHSFISYDVLLTIFPRSFLTVILRILRLIGNIGICLLAFDYLHGPLKYFGVWCLSIGKGYLKTMVTAAYIFIAEHRRIKKIHFSKKLLYIVTFPIFDVIGRLSMVMALFMKVEWKPIPHTSVITIEELKKSA